MLDQFKIIVLVPNYLKRINADGNEIQEAFSKFLNDTRNPRAKSLEASIKNKGMNITEFVDLFAKIYHDVNFITHTCYMIYKFGKVYSEFYGFLRLTGLLTDKKKECIKIIAAVLPNQTYEPTGNRKQKSRVQERLNQIHRL